MSYTNYLLKVSQNATKLSRFRSCLCCGVCLMLALNTGCPMASECGIPNATCCDRDEDCDNVDPCNPQICISGGICMATPVECTDGETCSEGQCVSTCETDADCDDANICTTTTCVDSLCTSEDIDCDDGDNCTVDSCDSEADGCVNTAVACETLEICDEDSGMCVAIACNTDEDCPSDDNLCTTEVCVGQACESQAKDCNDGDPCTDDTCEEATGECVNEAVVCPDGCPCEQGVCLADGCCEDDSDCPDDGFFCNGLESCGADGGCTSSGDPCEGERTCDDAAICDEDTDSCQLVEGDSIMLINGVDNISGGDCDDSIFAVVTNAGTSTLSAGDTLNGGGGIDSLTVVITANMYLPVAEISNIENIIIKNFNATATSFNALNITGATNFISDSSLFAVTFTQIGELASIDLDSNIKDVTAEFLDTVLSGINDTVDVTIEDSNGTIADGAKILIGSITKSNAPDNGGPETLAITSEGTNPNWITSIDDNGENDLTTLTITGSQDLRIDFFGDSITTISAPLAIGDLHLSAPFASTNNFSITTGLGDDTITAGQGADTITTGSGLDTFSLDNSATTTVVADTITDFDPGTSSAAIDKIEFDRSEIEGLTEVADLVDTSANSAFDSSTIQFVALASDGATVSGADIVGIIGDYADAAAALAAKTDWTIVYGSTLSDNDAFLIAYTSGSDVRIAIAIDNSGGADSDSVDSVTDVLILKNVSLDKLDDSDFTVIKA